MNDSRLREYKLRKAFFRQYLLQKLARQRWMRIRSEERQHKIEDD